MANNDAVRFLADCKKDPALAAEFLQAGAAGFPILAGRKGYKCSAADVVREARALSDEQLTGVSGGKIAQSDTPDTLMSLLTALRAST
jgi:hypothetical protein